MAKLRDKGENWVVEQIIESLATQSRPGEGPGDDAAVVYLESGPTLLLCIDTVTEGVHFRRDISSPYDIGWKSVAVNISDIAAMGGSPDRIVISICAPADAETEVVSEIVAGASGCAARFGATIVGGDTTESPVLSVTAAALGSMDEEVAPVLRSGARPGDAVLVTGTLGEAELGRVAALAGRDLDDSSVIRHRRPIPRLKEGLRAGRLGATSMIDISDGLLLDASRLARASGVKLTIDIDSLPVAGEGEDSESLTAALGGGEDFELLFTVGPKYLDTLIGGWDQDLAPVSVIGEVLEGEGVQLRPEESVPKPLGHLGWEHFGEAGRRS